MNMPLDKMQLSEEEWRALLTPEQYEILRQKGTEPPFSGEYAHKSASGMYTCAACGNELFSSDTQFDSGSGWPSFWDVAEQGRVELKDDTRGGMKRVEVVCARCGGHLGHLFDDGPTPTGKRFCINSACLRLEKK